jgi:hypothetical protein
MSFWHRFIGLDENITNHYLDSKICPYRFWDGILIYRFWTKISVWGFHLQSLKSTPIDYGVESFVGYSKPKLLMVDSKLEFIVESKFRSLSMEFQFFGMFLPKSARPKLLFDSIDPYIGFLMLRIGSFWLTEIFGWASFLIVVSWKSSIEFSLYYESSLCCPPPSMVTSSPLGAYPKYR